MVIYGVITSLRTYKAALMRRINAETCMYADYIYIYLDLRLFFKAICPSSPLMGIGLGNLASQGLYTSAGYGEALHGGWAFVRSVGRRTGIQTKFRPRKWY